MLKLFGTATTAALLVVTPVSFAQTSSHGSTSGTTGAQSGSSVGASSGASDNTSGGASQTPSAGASAGASGGMRGHMPDFSAADKNSDGQVSRSEWDAFFKGGGMMGGGMGGGMMNRGSGPSPSTGAGASRGSETSPAQSGGK